MSPAVPEKVFDFLPARRCQWFPARVLLPRVPARLNDWLTERGSLTARLVKFSHGDFSVRILSQYWGVATLSERRLLELPPRAQVLVREVVLQGCGQPWVFARSILPRSTLTGRLQCLARLNNRPLGGWLFKQPTLRRGPLQVSLFTRGDRRLRALQPVLDPGRQPSPLAGRRSVFYVDEKPILVGEVFLPDFLAALAVADNPAVTPVTVSPVTLPGGVA